MSPEDFKAKGYDISEDSKNKEPCNHQIFYYEYTSNVGKIVTYHAIGRTVDGYRATSSGYTLHECLTTLDYWFKRMEEHEILERQFNLWFGDTWKPVKEPQNEK